MTFLPIDWVGATVGYLRLSVTSSTGTVRTRTAIVDSFNEAVSGAREGEVYFQYYSDKIIFSKFYRTAQYDPAKAALVRRMRRSAEPVSGERSMRRGSILRDPDGYYDERKMDEAL